MKNLILIAAFLIVPFTLSAQNTTAPKKDTITETKVKTEMIAVKKVEPISDNPKMQNKTLNFKKSNDLISVKAYIKSLQLKRKETLMS